MNDEDLLYLLHFLEVNNIDSIIKQKTDGKATYDIRNADGLSRITLQIETIEQKPQVDSE